MDLVARSGASGSLDTAANGAGVNRVGLAAGDAARDGRVHAGGVRDTVLRLVAVHEGTSGLAALTIRAAERV